MKGIEVDESLKDFQIKILLCSIKIYKSSNNFTLHLFQLITFKTLVKSKTELN